MSYIPIVLCAGLGTRMRPLTTYVPKAVVPIAHTPVACHLIKLFLDHGFSQVHCNVHHLAEYAEEEIMQTLLDQGYHEDCVRFWRESEILETGGGIASIVQSLHKEDPGKWRDHDVIAVAGDVYGGFPVAAAIAEWERRKDAKTCALMITRPLLTQRPDVTWVDQSAQLVKGFGADYSESSPGLTGRLFTTLQIISGEHVLVAQVTKQSSRDLFYRAGLSKGLKIAHMPWPEGATWFDIGDYAAYADCLSKFGQGDQMVPRQCLILTDQKKNTTGDNIAAGEKSSKDSFWGVFDASSSLFHLTKVTLPGSWGNPQLLRTLPVLPDGLTMEERALGLTLRSTSRDPSPMEDPSSILPKSPPLLFALGGTHLGLGRPLLVPLELLERLALLSSPAPSSGELVSELSLASFYQSSRTFFLVC